MSNTLTVAGSILPPYVILACRKVLPDEPIAVLVINDEPQQLLEAFSCKDIEESCLIQMTLEKRHPTANFLCLSPQIMVNLFAALMLSDDGCAMHDNVFKSATLSSTVNKALNNHPLFKILMVKNTYEQRLSDINRFVSQLHRNLVEVQFNIQPESLENNMGHLMALMGIKEDE